MHLKIKITEFLFRILVVRKSLFATTLQFSEFVVVIGSEAEAAADIGFSAPGSELSSESCRRRLRSAEEGGLHLPFRWLPERVYSRQGKICTGTSGERICKETIFERRLIFVDDHQLVSIVAISALHQGTRNRRWRRREIIRVDRVEPFFYGCLSELPVLCPDIEEEPEMSEMRCRCAVSVAEEAQDRFEFIGFRKYSSFQRKWKNYIYFFLCFWGVIA